MSENKIQKNGYTTLIRKLQQRFLRRIRTINGFFCRICRIRYTDHFPINHIRLPSVPSTPLIPIQKPDRDFFQNWIRFTTSIRPVGDLSLFYWSWPRLSILTRFSSTPVKPFNLSAWKIYDLKDMLSCVSVFTGRKGVRRSKSQRKKLNCVPHYCR